MTEKKIDTHVHLLLSKKQTMPNWSDVKNIMDVALIGGLDAVCITEHIEAAGYEALMNGLFVHHLFDAASSVDGTLSYNGVAIFPGAELELADKSNLGVHTDLPTLLSLNRTPGAYTIDSIYETLKAQGTPFKLVAHHVFWPGKTPADMQLLGELVDAIEVPAKDLINIEKYTKLARDLNLGTTGGSDAHTFIQVGACQTIIRVKEARELKQGDWISSEATCHTYCEQSNRLVAMAKIHRQSLVA